MTTKKFDVGPFGKAEGGLYRSRQEIEKVFLELDNAPESLRVDPERTDIHAIVGRIGSGKSLHLRRMEMFASDFRDEYVIRSEKAKWGVADPFHVANSLAAALSPSLDTISQVWEMIWYRSIVRSLYTHLKAGELPTKKSLSATLAALGPTTDLLDLKTSAFPRSPANQAKAIARRTKVSHQDRHAAGQRLLDYVSDDRWDDLDQALGELLAKSGPVRIFIDSLDDDWDHHPISWLCSQRGLFRAINKWDSLSRLPHVSLVGAFRDATLPSEANSDNALKNIEHERVVVLGWTNGALIEFFERKIASLPDHLKPGDREVSTISDWLSRVNVTNTERQIQEPIDQYLVRHTRCIPRDVVSLGNRLSHHIRKGDPAMETEVLRNEVSRSAKNAARSQLGFASKHAKASSEIFDFLRDPLEIESQMRPTVAGLSSKSWTDRLERVIVETIHHERLSPDDVDRLDIAGRKAYGEDAVLSDIMWQNGLLGYQAHGRDDDMFFVAHAEGELHFPRAKIVSAVVHPCLLDVFQSIRYDQDPVYPQYVPHLGAS